MRRVLLRSPVRGMCVALCLVLHADAFTLLPHGVKLPTRPVQQCGGRPVHFKPDPSTRFDSVGLRASSALGDLRKAAGNDEGTRSVSDSENDARARALSARSIAELSLEEKKQFMALIGATNAEAAGFFRNEKATYALKWVKKGDQFVVENHFTTSERLKALRSWRAANGKNDDKSFASESTKVSVKADGKGPIATASRTKKEQVVRDTSTMVRAALAAEFGVAEINFIPMKDGSVLEYGTPRSDVEKEQFMADLGASYALHWVRRGDKFIVDKDFTTEARKKALRQVRRDDKLYATESRNYQLNADGTGPIATAARTGKEQELTDTSKMARAALAKEFGIKRITFVPLPDGSVIEYGSPSYEEAELLKLLSLLIQELAVVPTFFKFLKLALETLCVLRNVVVIEGPTELMAGVRKSTSALLEGIMALENKMKQEALTTGRSAASRRLFAFRVFITPVSFIVTKFTFAKESFDAWRQDQDVKRRRKNEEKNQLVTA